MSSPWKKSPNVQPRTKIKAWIFVNSFSFNFLEFLAKIYWTNFFPWAEKAKKGGTWETGLDRPPKQGGPAGPVRPAQVGPGGGSPWFLPELLLFDFLLRSEIFKGSLNKENEVPRVFLFGLFIWPNWELGNPSHQAIFCIHAAAMASPRSLELKQGAKEPSMKEVKRCKLKLLVEIKRTARIRCGGRVPTGAITSHNSVEEEKVPTPVRRSARIRGMKRKDYKEVSPETKDYGDSDYSDDRSPSSWAAAGRDDNDLYIWEKVPKEKTPEGPNGGGNDDGGDDNGDGDDGDGGDPGDDDPFGMHPMCCVACRHSISKLYASVDECFQAMEAMRQRMEDLERVVEEDYKFLNCNVRKLFGTVGNMRGKWCNSCGKYH
jgi:hypothetical protein